MKDDSTSILSPDRLRTVSLSWTDNFPNASQTAFNEKTSSSSLLIWDISPHKPKSYCVEIHEGQMISFGETTIQNEILQTKQIDLLEIDPGCKIRNCALLVSRDSESEDLAFTGYGIYVWLDRRWEWLAPDSNVMKLIKPKEHLYGLLSPWFSFIVFGVDA